MTEELSVELAERLRRDELDLAIISSLPETTRRQLAIRPLASEQLALIVAPDHRLAGRRSVSLHDLRDDVFVAFPAGATIRDTFTAADHRSGFDPHIGFEITGAPRMRAFVAQGLGVAIVPISEAHPSRADVVAVSLRTHELVHAGMLAWRHACRLGPAAAALRKPMLADYES